jgi:hypothetical protein
MQVAPLARSLIDTNSLGTKVLGLFHLTSDLHGEVRWAPVQSLWFTGMAVTAVVGREPLTLAGA